MSGWTSVSGVVFPVLPVAWVARASLAMLMALLIIVLISVSVSGGLKECAISAVMFHKASVTIAGGMLQPAMSSSTVAAVFRLSYAPRSAAAFATVCAIVSSGGVSPLCCRSLFSPTP